MGDGLGVKYLEIMFSVGRIVAQAPMVCSWVKRCITGAIGDFVQIS